MDVYVYSEGRPPGVHGNMYGIPYKLLDWIDVTNLNYRTLSKNTNARCLFEHPLHSSHTNKIDWDSLSENTAPWATHLLEQQPEKINWYVLSGNPSTHAIRMLRQEINRVNNLTYAQKLLETCVETYIRWTDFFMGTYNYEKYVYTKIDWHHLSANPGAMKLLEEEYNRDPQNHRIDDSGLTQNPKMNAWAMNLLEETYTKKPLMWDWLSGNPSPFAKQLLEKYPEKINWHELSKNSSPWAIQLLEQHSSQANKIDWYNLSRNTSPFAIRLLEETYKKNPQKISWYSLSENTQAIHILEQSILEQKYGNGNDTIGWIALSSNPKAIHILEQHPDKIHYTVFSRNPAIFTYDYHQMKIDKHELHEDLIRTVFHPDNIQCFLGWGFYTDE